MVHLICILLLIKNNIIIIYFKIIIHIYIYMNNKIYKLYNYTGNRPDINDDFYGWSNHKWFLNNKIPDDDINYTHFTETQNKINLILKEILESGKFKLGNTLYLSYLNKNYRNKYTLNELLELTKITSLIKSYDDIITVATRLIFININTIFNLYIDSNIYSSCNYILYISQASLTLPDRSYYYEDKHKSIRQKYYEMIYKIYQEIFPKMKNIDNIINIILNIETKIAIIQLDEADKRDTDKIYHKINIQEANNKYDKLNINGIIDILCLLTDYKVIKQNFINIIIEHINDDSTNYFKQLEQLLYMFSLEEWIEFFKYKIIIGYIYLTNNKLYNIYFDFFNKILKGQNKQKEDWKIALNITSSLLDEPLSKIYADKYFTKEIEIYMKDMVNNIKKATEYRIKKLDWMTDHTKEKALLKLHKMKLKIGYGYTNNKEYNIKLSKSIIKNVLMLNIVNCTNELDKLNRNVNFNDWDGITSFSVNAYFNPSRNEIIFPAAILQPPFVDLTKSDIYNYSNIGSVIGHEIIHGFDDQGSKFDENGSLVDWWNKVDRDNFNKKVLEIIKLYDNEGINGKLTAGENIADFGAVIMPLYALIIKYKRNLTDDELRKYYIAYSSHWQYLIKPELVNIRLLTDPHAFANLRVNIPLKNQKKFQEVFNIKKKSKMYNRDFLTIW